MDKETKKILGIMGLVVLFFIVLSFVLVWSAKRDKALEEWADKYEDCVMEEYGMTPSAWYAEKGEYPECKIK